MRPAIAFQEIPPLVSPSCSLATLLLAFLTEALVVKAHDICHSIPLVSQAILDDSSVLAGRKIL